MRPGVHDFRRAAQIKTSVQVVEEHGGTWDSALLHYKNGRRLCEESIISSM